MPDEPQTKSGAELELGLLREHIDAIDAELLALLNKRASVSLDVGKLKARTGAPVFRPQREEAVLRRLASANPGPLRENHLRAVYREIFAASRDLQHTLHVAYLGPEGTFSNMACLEYFGGSSTFEPMPRIADIFEAVERGRCQFGLAPLENSVHGTVGETLDLFAAHDVHVEAEWISRIRLSLLSRETSPGAVRVVYSHPQPLGQCAGWLRQHLPGARFVSLESTAAAAHRAAREKGSAAVCHAGLAARLGLDLLASGIEDIADNRTRFFIIGPGSCAIGPSRADSRVPESGGTYKSSLVFALADKPGSLASVLAVLASAGINMSKLESRPLRGERWKYLFFADLDCDITINPDVLDALREHCLRIKVLGAYAVCAEGGDRDVR